MKATVNVSLDEVLEDNFEYIAKEVINYDPYLPEDIVEYVSRNKKMFSNCNIV